MMQRISRTLADAFQHAVLEAMECPNESLCNLQLFHTV